MANPNWVKGMVPWNKGIKTGIVPPTAFKKGHNLIKLPEQKIVLLYEQGLTCRKIGRLYGIDHKSISARLRKNGVKLRSKSEDKLLWKNPQYTNGNSPSIWLREAYKIYPRECSKCGATKNLRVHHIDEDRENNPLDGSNWQILCHRCHRTLHSGVLPEGRTVTCEQCGKTFYKKPSKFLCSKHHFCSHRCYGSSRVGSKHSEETKEKMRENAGRFWKGKSLSEEHKRKIAAAHIKRPPKLAQ